MKLRVATIQDIPLLQQWDTKPHVIDASGDDDNLDWEKEVPRNVPWQKILIAENKSRPIGVIIVIDPQKEDTHYWGDCEANLLALDIWIGEEENLGKGYGTEMMTLVLNQSFKNPNIRAILVDPLVRNTRAHAFYERLGFKRIDRRFFGPDDCFVYRLERSDWVMNNSSGK